MYTLTHHTAYHEKMFKTPHFVSAKTQCKILSLTRCLFCNIWFCPITPKVTPCFVAVMPRGYLDTVEESVDELLLFGQFCPLYSVLHLHKLLHDNKSYQTILLIVVRSLT